MGRGVVVLYCSRDSERERERESGRERQKQSEILINKQTEDYGKGLLLTRSPGKAISGLDVMVILARACADLTFPTTVLSDASGIRACGAARGGDDTLRLVSGLSPGMYRAAPGSALPFLPPEPPRPLGPADDPPTPGRPCIEKGQ